MARRGLRNTWLVLRREYLERVCSRSFVLTTILMPAFLLAMVLMPAWLAGQPGEQGARLVVVSADRSLGETARDRLAVETKGAYQAYVDTDTSRAEHDRLASALRQGRIDAYVWVGSGAAETADIVYFTRNPGDFIGRELVRDALTFALRRHRLIQRGVAPDEADAMLATVKMRTVDIAASKRAGGDPFGAILAATGLVLLLFMTLLSYGVMVMRSVMEEKGSRIVEVLLCSLTADELMAGKIVGTGAVGLTQAAVWGVILALLVPHILAMLPFGTAHLSASWFVYFGVFYALGFLLYAAMFAALGAAFDSMEDAQQWNLVIISPLIAATVLMGPAVSAPNSPLAIAGSMVPFCSPLLMYTRIVVSHPPAWQIALSMALLLATTYAVLRLCARIYRVGILMYGKRVRLGEIVKWLRYS